MGAYELTKEVSSSANITGRKWGQCVFQEEDSHRDMFASHSNSILFATTSMHSSNHTMSTAVSPYVWPASGSRPQI